MASATPHSQHPQPGAQRPTLCAAPLRPLAFEVAAALREAEAVHTSPPQPRRGGAPRRCDVLWSSPSETRVEDIFMEDAPSARLFARVVTGGGRCAAVMPLDELRQAHPQLLIDYLLSVSVFAA